MPNLALYRKYRPDTFQSVVGQDTIVRILKNQIQTGRIGHAYLFSGIRGTGKTSMAKIFAKAVNCENPIDGNPCGVCSSCKRLNSSNDINVIEIDAASNRGVDEVREIKDKIKYPPSDGNYKVYIIDEAHMLTKEAFNALLKTLEEPPEHAILILATTEPQRLPSTILSRCQQYNVKPITQEVLKEALTEITKKENINIEEAALEEIAKRGDHSMRDSLSLLDQCSDLELPGDLITLESIQNFLGVSPTEQLTAIAKFQAARDGDGLIRYLNDLRKNGTNDQILLEDLSNFYQNLLYFKITGSRDNNFQDSYKELKDYFTIEELYSTIDTLLKAHSRLKYNSLGEIITNTALLSLCIEKEEESVRKVMPKEKIIPPKPIPKKTVQVTDEQSRQSENFNSSVEREIKTDQTIKVHENSPDVEEKVGSVNEEVIAEKHQVETNKETGPSEEQNQEINVQINAATLKNRLIEVAESENLSLIQSLLEDSEIRLNKNGLFILLKKDHEWMFSTANFQSNLINIANQALGQEVRVYPKIKEDYYAYLEAIKNKSKNKTPEETTQEKLRKIVGNDIEVQTVED